MKTPYNNLNPDLILNAIESIGIRCSGSLLALNSYENRVYQVGIEDAPPLIAKFYRPNRWSKAAILEEHAFAAELLAHEIPVVAPLSISTGGTLHEYEGFSFALFPRQGGRMFEIDNLEQLEWMGRFIGRIHAIGSCQPFQHRLELNVDQYGVLPFQFLLENQFIPSHLVDKYIALLDELLIKMKAIMSYVGDFKKLRLHGDCHPGNILWNTQGPQIVDLDDCLMGPAVQDIWMLLSGGSLQDTNLQLDTILSGYEEFCSFNFRELKLIEVLRTLRMIHYSAWLAKRWEDPAFPLNFPWFNTEKYWEEQFMHLMDQNELLELVV